MDRPVIVIPDIHHYGDDLTVPEAVGPALRRRRGHGHSDGSGAAGGDPRGNPRHGFDIAVRPTLGAQRELPPGIASADPAVTGLYEIPDLTSRWDYERGNLAADLQVADGDPALAQAAEAYRAAAREEFWLEAARLSRRRLTPGAGDETEDEDGTEPENTGDGEPARTGGRTSPTPPPA